MTTPMKLDKFDSFKKELHQLIESSYAVLDNSDNSIDKRESAMGRISGCHRVLHRIAVQESGNVESGWLLEITRETIRELNEIVTRANYQYSNVNSFVINVRSVWERLGHYIHMETPMEPKQPESELPMNKLNVDGKLAPTFNTIDTLPNTISCPNPSPLTFPNPMSMSESIGIESVLPPAVSQLCLFTFTSTSNSNEISNQTNDRVSSFFDPALQKTVNLDWAYQIIWGDEVLPTKITLYGAILRNPYDRRFEPDSLVYAKDSKRLKALIARLPNWIDDIQTTNEIDGDINTAINLKYVTDIKWDDEILPSFKNPTDAKNTELVRGTSIFIGEEFHLALFDPTVRQRLYEKVIGFVR